MARLLKKWNGRIWLNGKQGHCSIAAYSQKQAAELLEKASGYNGTLGEIRIYFSKTWGNNMNGIEPTEPCLYYNSKSWDNEPPKRIL